MLKHLIPLAAVLVIGGIGGIGAQAQPVKPAQPADPLAAAPRISAAEAKKAIDAGQAVLVDVRSAPAYQAEHAKGAIHIPIEQAYARADELPKDRLIITYCACSAEQSSAGAVLELRKKGHENAAALLGGLKAWKDAGYGVEWQPAP
ncbi:MAG TPA: rhodanese-like domain-containing protein [Thermoanaerobaculia bacterium]|nr:rhodanese-like domain-containing protein [Thermoanaerobaculia bacterium]